MTDVCTWSAWCADCGKQATTDGTSEGANLYFLRTLYWGTRRSVFVDETGRVWLVDNWLCASCKLKSDTGCDIMGQQP